MNKTMFNEFALRTALEQCRGYDWGLKYYYYLNFRLLLFTNEDLALTKDLTYGDLNIAAFPARTFLHPTGGSDFPTGPGSQVSLIVPQVIPPVYTSDIEPTAILISNLITIERIADSTEVLPLQNVYGYALYVNDEPDSKIIAAQKFPIHYKMEYLGDWMCFAVSFLLKSKWNAADCNEE